MDVSLQEMFVKTIAAITLGFTLINAIIVQGGVYASTMDENSSKTIKHRDLTIDLGNGNRRTQS